ncbi:CHAT domain-containing protein [Leptolyngbya sp. BC1307]|uniref:CHAT domain-containing protein n=1 Tax=Leptolyngbya sp. BC1307 TaxID=2029589 RepID=UPI000EFA8F18|nr:CHAT domain-containing protein [Leptolyngbya sp. BC1307]
MFPVAAMLPSTYAVTDVVTRTLAESAFGVEIGRVEVGQVEPVQLAQEPQSAAEDEVLQQLAVGSEQSQAGDFEAAIASYRQALVLIDQQAPIDLALKGSALSGLGRAYLDAEKYELALPVLESALALYEAIALDDPNFSPTDLTDALVSVYNLLGKVHHQIANFATALGYYQRGLTRDRSATRPEARAALLHNIGAVEAEIGQYAEAEGALQEAARLSKAVGFTSLEASAIFTLGWVYDRQQNYPQAIASYQSAIALSKSSGEISREMRALNNLSSVYLNQGDLAAAEEILARGFELLSEQDDAQERAILLNSLGALQRTAGEFEQAWSTHLQALRLSQQTVDVQGQIEVKLNLGWLMEGQAQPDLAIFFYKQAIAQIESIRQDLRQLSQAMQQRYTFTVEDLYRNLADLLLQQNRVGEALQVLELLKLQEVESYLHGGQASQETGLNTPAETGLSAEFDDLLAGNKPDISLADFIGSAAIALSDPSAASTESAFKLRSIDDLQAALAEQPVKSAALYPLILGDRLELILITADGPLVHYTTAVSQQDLSSTVGELKRMLSTDVLDARPSAGQLYDWLIRPLEETLSDRQIENIIYLPDGVLRYVPIAALYDGEQWLAQKYQSHNITAAAIDDLTAKPDSALSVLAGAFTADIPAYQVEVGEQRYLYEGLPAAKQEIENLAAVIPNTVALLDHDFSPGSTLSAVGDQRIVHLATHAKFVPGQPEESFVLFGDGSTVDMQGIGQWQLPNVDLVVFSACQTAVSLAGSGQEILGLGFQVQQTGAGAAIASLWSVNDTATAALMNQFYLALSEGHTKAEALQRAQMTLMASDRFSHPHDWAAFILIGNGL